MTALGRYRARALAPRLDAHIAAEQALRAQTREGRAAAQLAKFNLGWANSLRRSPWARSLRDVLAAPDHFDDWRRLEDFAPRTTKETLREAIERVDASEAAAASNVRWLATGGTTAEPLVFPSFATEAENAALDLWRGRARFGVTPGSRLFLLWGHAHLFAAGLKGRIQRLKRRVADVALGYTRHSAYAMDPSALRDAGERLLRVRPDYVIGYSTALERFAAANAERASDFAALGLKIVIATAEGFRLADGRAKVASVFGAPVAMEYGTVETGPMAYETPTGGYATCLATARIDLDVGTDGAAARPVLATSLLPRALPLLRYAIGDRIAPDNDRDPAEGFSAVIGRANDAVATLSGVLIHSEAFTHVVRDVGGVDTYQIVRGHRGVASAIRYEAPAPLSDARRLEISRRLALIDPSLAELSLEHVERIASTVAGKSPMVVDAPVGANEKMKP